MILDQIAVESPSTVPTRGALRRGVGGLLVAAGRGVLAAIAGLALSAGIALILWAVTPAAGEHTATAVRAGIAGFAVGNLMPVHIAGATLTLAPLLVTAVMCLVLASGMCRGRNAPATAHGEGLAVVATAASYCLTVVVAVAVFASPGAVALHDSWRMVLLAACACLAGALVRGQAIRGWLVLVVPAWLTAGVRAGVAAVMVLVAGGGLLLALGLLAGFSTAAQLFGATGPGAAAGVGNFVLNAAFIPNAVIAGAGYAVGVGFGIGPGSYSPFGAHPGELPGVGLLAAVPAHATPSRLTPLVLVVPLAAGLIAAWVVSRRLATRLDRLRAVGAAALVAGALAGSVAVIAAGGVTGGRWASSGVPALALVGAVILWVGAAGGIAVAVIGMRTVPWRAAPVGTAAGAPGQTGAPADAAEESGPSEDDGVDCDTQAIDVGAGAAAGARAGAETATETDSRSGRESSTGDAAALGAEGPPGPPDPSDGR